MHNRWMMASMVVNVGVDQFWEFACRRLGDSDQITRSTGYRIWI
jgi:hypothetical protein